MANQVMGGFRWLRDRNGGSHQPIEERPVATGYATGIFRGDVVKKVSDGTVAVCAAGDAAYGVVQGAVRYKDSAGLIRSGSFLPASTSYSGAPSIANPTASIVAITPVRNQLFEVDFGTLAASITAAQSLVGNNCDFHTGAGGSTSTGRSSYYADNSSVGTATANLRILEVSPWGTGYAQNDVTAANWKGIVEFNEGEEPVPGNATGT